MASSSLVEKFNAMSTTPRCVSISELEQHIAYSVLNASVKDAKYGRCVVLNIQMKNSAEILSVYLPKKYTNVFGNSELYGINSGETTVSLIFNGYYPNTKAYDLTLVS